jgi:hypothetical protein
MNMPAFTAEASLYQTNNHYRFAVGGSFLSDGNTTVTPQACGWFKGIICGAAIAGGSVLCIDACLAGPAPCALCWTGALSIVGYGFCRDCIPAWMRALIDIFEGGGGGGGGGSGGGGGGNVECCEFNDDGTCAIRKPPHGQCP